MSSVILNGNTYTDANFTGTSYADPNKGLLAALRDVAAHGANILQAASANSLTPGNGSISITITVNRPYLVGATVRLQRVADVTCYMQGAITAFNSSTGAITINVTSFSTGASGAGPFTDWQILGLGLAGPQGPAGNVSSGGTVSGTLAFSGAAENWALATIASAATMAIGAAAANVLSVTGTTTVNAFDSVQAGTLRLLLFTTSLQLTHNATSLILPWNVPVITSPNDSAIMVSLGAGNWQCVDYNFANISLARVNRRARMAAALQ
jgi:hypothetical protein